MKLLILSGHRNIVANTRRNSYKKYRNSPRRLTTSVTTSSPIVTKRTHFSIEISVSLHFENDWEKKQIIFEKVLYFALEKIKLCANHIINEIF